MTEESLAAAAGSWSTGSTIAWAPRVRALAAGALAYGQLLDIRGCGLWAVGSC